MTNFMIIAKVNGVEYLTKVSTESEYSAEHRILDMGICGKHEYGVEACMAYTTKAMKTDTFIVNAINAEPIALEDLARIISWRNKEIEKKDEAESRIHEIEKQMKALQSELASARAILKA